MSPDEGPLARLYRRWLDDLWNGDLALAEEILAPDFTGHWPNEPSRVRGPRELATAVREAHSYFAEVRFEIEVGPVVDGELVAARWRGRGTLVDGAGGGHASFAGHDLLRADGERFVEYWVIAEQPA